MEKVKCDHCGTIISKEDAIPCQWKEYNLVWYYCKKCDENCFKKIGENMSKKSEWDKVLNPSIIKKLKYKLLYLKYKYTIWREIKLGYIEKDGTPIKCYCGSKDLDDYEVYTLDGYGTPIIERSVRCKKCKKHLGTWSCGNWDI